MKAWHSFLLVLLSLLLFNLAGAKDFSVECMSLPEGLVACWQADKSDTTLQDGAGNDLTGVCSGEKQKPTLVETEIGPAFYFTHVGESGGPSVKIKTSSLINPPAPEFTIAAWIKLDAEAKTQHNRILRLKDSYHLMVTWSKLRFDYETKENEKIAYTSPEDFERKIFPGKWYFVAVTHDRVRVRMYINGMMVLDEKARGYPRASKAGNNLILGNYCSSFTNGTFRGILGPVLMFNRALAQEDILKTIAAFL